MLRRPTPVKLKGDGTVKDFASLCRRRGEELRGLNGHHGFDFFGGLVAEFSSTAAASTRMRASLLRKGIDQH